MKENLRIFAVLTLVLSVNSQNNSASITATTTATPATHSSHLHIEEPQPQISSLERLQRNNGSRVAYNEVDYESYKNDTPEAVEIKSENYPNPYPPRSHNVWNITVENATGFELVLHFFDIDPTTDFLNIHLADADSEEDDSGIILTGKLKSPLKLRSPHSPHLQIEFSTNSPTGHTHGGFLLTYSPFGEIPAPITKPPEETTFAPEGVSSFSTLLTVRERDQNNETWALFRELLCQATNNFTMNHNMTLEICHPENVTFTSITKCSSLWPNNLECIELSFHILLAEGKEEDVTEDPLNGFEFSFPQELSAENLEAMWREFGEDIFKTNKFPRYIQPQANGLILFWSGMVVAAIIVFILFLILISRLQVLKSVVKWPAVDEDNQNILKKSQDIDITMFPSPHQIVPTLFPSSTSAYSPGSSFLYGGDVYDNRPRDALECFNETDPSLLPGLRRNSSFGIDAPPTLSLDSNDDRLHPRESYGKGSGHDESVS